MNRVDYMNLINDLLEKAENELSNEQFNILLKRVKETVEDYQ